jgi:hypothetical protein
MSNQDNRDKINSRSNRLNRRNMLLGGTTFAAASAIVSGSRVQVAQAQPAAPSGRKPNILMIMSDDIGWFNVSAYNMGIMGRRILTASAEKARFSQTTMASRVALPAALHSSPDSRRFAPG